MKITADVSSIMSSDRTVIVEHGEGADRRQVTFGITLYKRNSFSEDNDTFRAPNEYWASLPEREQAEIYAIYEDVRELFDSSIGYTELKEELTKKVTQLMRYHETGRVINWIKHNPLLKVPSGPPPRGIAMTYKHDVDKDTTPDQTYIYSDYLGLMALSVILRVMIPIWAMYNKPAKDATSKEHKEVHSFLLLRNSEIYDSEPMRRLDRYISANIKKDTFTGNHTLAFICSDDMPFVLRSLVCVRKLCLGELYFDHDPRQNLAALVYVYIVDRPAPQGNNYSEQVREKKIRKEGAGETTENSGSTLEMYKGRATITVGRIAELEYALRDPIAIALQLCQDGDAKLIEADMRVAMDTSKELLEKEIKKPQQVLAPWVLAPVFPPQAVFHMEEDKMATMCAITEVVLRHRGFGYLALLSTAVAMPEDTGMRITPQGSRAQIGDDLSSEVEKYFPFRREPRRKTATHTSYCFVTEDIKKLAAEFTRYTWRATAAESLVRQVLGTHMRRLPLLSQLRSDLTSMLVDAERRLS